MNEPSSRLERLSEEAVWRLEEACCRFEEAWQTGQRPTLEDFVATLEGEERLALLRELLRLEVHYRRRAGEGPSAADYATRFPEATAVLHEVFAAPDGPPSAQADDPERTTDDPERTGPEMRLPSVDEGPALQNGLGDAGATGALPRAVGRYPAVGKIGQGGMGIVYRGRDPTRNRPLAIKVLLAEHRGQADVEQRFFKEVQITAQLQHPGVPPVHEVGHLDDGRPFFAMKLVQGRTLAELLKERRDLAENLPRFLAVCQTLAYAHSRGIIHRDLKPSNIMVGAFGEVQVMDWGLAKPLARETSVPAEEPSTVLTVRTAAAPLSQAGTVVGTPAYMAPEQARAEAHLVDERADVFGLGALLCVLLTGQPPYAGSDREWVYRQAARADLADAFARLDACGADAELVRLAKGCLAPYREDRPRDAGEVAGAVEAYQTGVTERLRRAELERAAAEARAEEEKRTRQVAEAKAAVERRARRLTVGLAAAALLLILAGGGGSWWWQHQRAEAEQRQRQTDEAVRVAMAEARRLSRHGREAPLVELSRYYQAAVDAGRRAAALAKTGEASGAVRRQAQDLETELEAELKAVAKDRQFLARLLDVRGPLETPAYRNRESGIVVELAEPSADEQFAAAFRDWGLDVDATPIEEAVARLKARPPAVVAEAVAALDEWAAECRPQSPQWRRLTDLAVALDAPGPRHELRGILARNRLTQERALGELSRALLPWTSLTGQVPGADRNRLRALAGQTEVASEPVLGVLLLVQALVTIGDDDLAEGLLRAAVRARPGEVVLLHALGVLLERHGPPRWAEAVKCYTAARAVRPELGLALARTLAEAGQSDEGLAVCQELLRLQPKNPIFHLQYGYIHAKQGRHKAAEVSFRRAIALQPNFAKAHNNLGAALAKTGNYREAEAALHHAIDLQLNIPQVHYNLGATLGRQGKHKEAEAAFPRPSLSDPITLKPTTTLATSCWNKARPRRRRPLPARLSLSSPILLRRTTTSASP
jgi:serine/threonine-protein kinase